MRKIAGLNEALYHQWVIAPSVEPEPRNRRSRSGIEVGYRVLAFVYVDFEEGISLWVEAPLVFDREGRYVRDLRRNQKSRAAPVAPYLVPWTSLVPGQLRLASPEECARLGVGASPAALSGFNTPDSVAAALAETRFDPYRARGYPRDVNAQIAVDGDAIGEQVWVRLLFPEVADPDSWQAMLLQVPETPGLGLAVGEVITVSLPASGAPRMDVTRARQDAPDDDDEAAEPWAELEARAIACDEEGQFEESERCWRQVLAESGRIPYTLGNFATFLAKRERLDEALPIFLEAIEKQRLIVAKEAETAAPANTGEARDDADQEAPEDGERWLLAAIELGFAAALVGGERYVEARALTAPWLAEEAHAAEARQVWRDAQAVEARRAARGDLSAIWSSVLMLEKGHVRLDIQARHRAGRWEYRRAWAPMWDEATWAYDPVDTELRAVTPPLESWFVRLANPLACDVLREVPVPDVIGLSHANLLRARTDEFARTWDELCDLVTARDPSHTTRLVELLESPVWDRVAFSGPASSDEEVAAYQAALRRARFGWTEDLTLQDLDLAIGTTIACAERLEDADAAGRAIADLVLALPMLHALGPWARDLTLPPRAAVVELEVGLGQVCVVPSDELADRRVALVRDTRRWGVSLDGADPVWLPLGIGAEIWYRTGDARATAAEISEALLAHAEARRSGFDPREPAAVLADAESETYMAWSMGRWWYQRVRFGSNGRRFKAPKTSAWRTDIGRLAFGPSKGRAAPTLAPIYLHPMVAGPLSRAFDALDLPMSETVAAAWREMLARACGGDVALRDRD